MNIELIIIIAFIILLTFFLFIKRRNITIQKIAFPLLYFVLYKTKIGIKAMDNIAKSYSRFLDYFIYLSIGVGFLGILTICALLLYNLYSLLFIPEATPGVGLVLPIKAKGVFFVPFFYWIISILVIASVHEFCHGMIARKYNLKIKSSGFAFLAILLPIIPAAFVEPDEDTLKKRSHKEQLAVFSAGPFANIFLGILMLLVFIIVATPFIDATMDFKGANISNVVNGSPAAIANLSIGETIIKIDDKNITYLDEFSNVLQNKTPGTKIILKTDRAEYNITLGENPKIPRKAWLGVTVSQNRNFKEEAKEKYGEFLLNVAMWLIGLFYWLYLLNIGIGIFNLVPVGPIDGGRMAQIFFQKAFKKKGESIFKYVSILFLIIIVANIVIGFAK